MEAAQVQSGGSFDVDYEVVGPNEKIIMDGTKERQGDFVFTASETGEYRFCFNNEMSTFSDKFVDFEIAVCNEASEMAANPAYNTPIRSRTSIALPHYPLKPALHLSKLLLLRSLSSSFPDSSRQLHETRSISGRVRTETSVR